MQLKAQELQTFEAFKKAMRAAASQVKDHSPFCIFSDVQLPDASKKMHILKPFLVVGSPAQVVLPLLKNLKGGKKPVASGICSLQVGKLNFMAKSGRVDYGMLKTQAVALKDLFGKEILFPGAGGSSGPTADAKTAGANLVQQKARLSEAAVHWTSTRTVVDSRIGQLEQAVKKHYSKHPAALKELQKIMGKIDAALGKLDHRLSDALKATVAANPAAHETEVHKAKAVLAEYKRVVQSDPLIAHIDKNPFGVSTNLKQALMDSLNKAEHSLA